MEPVTVTIPKERLSEFYLLMSEFFRDDDQSVATDPRAIQVVVGPDATSASVATGGVTGKYAPLFGFFKAAQGKELELTFSEMEEALGQKLPPSARKHRPCWANSQVSLLGRVWLRAGWRLTDIDMQREEVRFERPNPVGDRSERGT